MRSLVIGGTGFIGLNIVRALQAEGLPVACTRRPSSNTLFLRKLKPEMVTADCMDPPSLRAALEGRDAVFMAAGHYPRYSIHLDEQVRHARTAIRNVLDAARATGVKRFIYTSSVTTGTPAASGSVYFSVKEAMEAEVMKELRNGLPGTILCPSACFGPFDVKAGTGGVLVGALSRKLPFFVEGKFNLIDVEDVARAHVGALKAPRLRERYVLAHHNTSASQFFDLLSRRYGAPIPRRLPLAVAYPFARLAESWHRRRGSRVAVPVEFLDMLRYGRHYDSADARADLHAYDTPIEETLDKAHDWFKRHSYIPPTEGEKR